MIKNSLYKNRNVLIILFIFSLYMIPYDGLPFFSYSTYAPSAIIAIIPAALIISICKHKCMKDEIILSTFVLVSIIHSIIAGAYYGSYYPGFKHSITLMLGIYSYMLFKYCFSKKEYYSIYNKHIKKAWLLPLVVGIFQLLNQFGLDFSFINSFTQFFVRHVYEFRIQMLSTEPSWAVMHLITIAVLLNYCKFRDKSNKIIVLIILLLYFFSFSAYGFSIFFLSGLLYMFFEEKWNSIIYKLTAFILLMTIAAMSLNFTIKYFGIDNYYIHRFDINTYMNNNPLEYDGSMFIRIVFPIIGFMEFFSLPLGYGGGYYYVKAKEIILDYFSYGLNYEEVYYYYMTDQLKAGSLYSRLLSEEGIFALFFFCFLYNIYKKNVHSKGEKIAFCVALAMNFNYASYCNFDFWLLLGALSGGYLNDENE